MSPQVSAWCSPVLLGTALEKTALHLSPAPQGVVQGRRWEPSQGLCTHPETCMGEGR